VIYGDEQAGIDNLKKAYDLVPSVRDNIRGHEADENLFQLAVAYLRNQQPVESAEWFDKAAAAAHGANIVPIILNDPRVIQSAMPPSLQPTRLTR
jgi:hypothetical protein